MNVCQTDDPRPTCAVCNRPVDELLEWEELLTLEFVFEARCHGEREEVRLTRRQMLTMTSVTPTVAFATKKLAP